MIRTKGDTSRNLSNYSEAQLQTMRAIAGRMALAKLVSGQSFQGNRDTYAQLGYPLQLSFDDFMGRYIRQDIAKAIIDRPVKKTWSGDLRILEASDENETRLEKEWKTLYEDFKLSSIFSRADKLTGIGTYGIILLGLDDVKTTEDYKKPVLGSRKLLYLKPLSSKTAQIKSFQANPQDKRFGLPLMYEITINDDSSQAAAQAQSITLQVHYSRVIHIVDDILESEIEGLPRLEVVFNRLMDLEKLVGGDAEMFWKGARPGYTGKVDKEFQVTKDFTDDLYDQIEEYEHGLSRFIVNSGVDLKELAQQIADPKNHVDVQIQMISAVTQIPKRILTGSERGELASSQDSDEWNSYIDDRREDYAEPRIIKPFIEAMQKYKILPAEQESYTIKWEELTATSDKDKAEIGKTRATAVKEYSQNINAQDIITPEAFLRYILGLPDDTVENIMQMREASLLEEPPVSDTEAALLQQEIDKSNQEAQ